MMQSINVEMVRDRAREIRESLDKIRGYAAQSDTDFFADDGSLPQHPGSSLLAGRTRAGVALCQGEFGGF